MSFFQIRSLSGAAWPAIPDARGSQLWATYLELQRTQWLNSGELEALQLRQLRVLLQHCFQEVPYYRRVLNEVGYPKRPITDWTEFRRVPILTRELCQANAADLTAKSLPAGMTAAGGGYTSGTNGVPLKVLKTDRVAFWWAALNLRDLEWSNLDPRGRWASIRLIAKTPQELVAAIEGEVIPYWSKEYDGLFEQTSAYSMDIRQDPRRQLAWLRRIHPTFVLSQPSNLDLLAEALQSTGTPPWTDLRAIQSIGEPLPAALQARIESAFGVPVKNLYSATEAGYIASPCPDGHGLHLHSENVIAEVLDADDQPCRPGETGRLVFTTLHNFLTPFIRYDILDDVTLAPEPCPCGRGLPLWTQVEGRRHASLHLADGQRKSSMGITFGVRKAGGSRQFQIVQRALDHVIVRVVPDATWNADRAESIRHSVQTEFGWPIRVDVEERPFLERSPGGKVRVVVIEMEGEASRGNDGR